jgi:hypothetical protein
MFMRPYATPHNSVSLTGFESAPTVPAPLRGGYAPCLNGRFLYFTRGVCLNSRRPVHLPVLRQRAASFEFSHRFNAASHRAYKLAHSRD